MDTKQIIAALKAREAVDGGATLTGSRRFKYNPDSDWDFVVPDDYGWKVWLRKQGFVQIYSDFGLHSKDYPKNCPDTAQIWERRIDDYSPKYNVIQVVLSKNYVAKRRIILWLEARKEIVDKYYKTNKEDRHKIWQFLSQQAEQGKI